jgi:hypothetical protein
MKRAVCRAGIWYLRIYVQEPPFWGGPVGLSLLEGFAVGTLIHHGVAFVGADHDPIQRAIVLGIAVMGAGLNGAFDALIGMAVHTYFLLCFGFGNSMPPKRQIMHCFFGPTVVSFYGKREKER